MKKQRVFRSIIVAAAIGFTALLVISLFRAKRQPSAGQLADVRSPAAPMFAQNSIPTAGPSSPPASKPASSIFPPPSKGMQTTLPRVIPLQLDEFDQRILLAPKEIATVQIDAGTSDSRPLKIDAPNGGSIDGRKAPAIVEPSDAARGLQFAVGPTRGLYTLEVSRGRDTRIFEFWVDRESPVGQPGPERTFVH